MGLGDKDVAIASAIILGFIALILAMAGAWLGAAGAAATMGIVLYTRLVRPTPPRR
ncbi:MAG TPA: hypothetical protein VGE14_04535 [Marmoricola sp.]